MFRESQDVQITRKTDYHKSDREYQYIFEKIQRYTAKYEFFKVL